MELEYILARLEIGQTITVPLEDEPEGWTAYTKLAAALEGESYIISSVTRPSQFEPVITEMPGWWYEQQALADENRAILENGGTI